MRLSSDQKRFYDENGFLAVENAVPAERVEAMRARIEDLCARWDSDEARRLNAQQEASIAGAVTALMTRPDSTPLLSTIHCPALILVGDEDLVTPKATADEMHDGIAGSKLAVISGAGHLSNLEQPDAFNDALARFLEHQV